MGVAVYYVTVLMGHFCYMAENWPIKMNLTFMSI